MRELIITFDGPPGPISPQFLDVEDAETGKSVSIEWSRLAPGLYALGPFADWKEAQELQKGNERLRGLLTQSEKEWSEDAHRLRAALKRYGGHDKECLAFRNWGARDGPWIDGPCTCGLAEALGEPQSKAVQE